MTRSKRFNSPSLRLVWFPELCNTERHSEAPRCGGICHPPSVIDSIVSQVEDMSKILVENGFSYSGRE